jgi:2-polyprenyl-3-methyl-5-hydroxy-6-metoxy-1,4-benzoquinol methylase
MDYGCGTGVLLDGARRYARLVYGVDTVLEAAELLVNEWHLDRVDLLTPTQAERDVPRGSVDIILAAEVLEHIQPLQRTLAFFESCLKPSGKLLASLPTEGWLYRLGRRLAGFRGHYHHSNARSIDYEIVRAGFRRQRLKKIPGPGVLALYWIAEYDVRQSRHTDL